jgi:hypothetical protein
VARPARVAACYTCGSNPAGNAVGGPNSAYCESCQPVNPHPVIGTAWLCPVCKEAFGRLKDADGHQVINNEAPRSVTCKDPGGLGLSQDERGVWQTSAGLSRRERARGMAPGRRW